MTNDQFPSASESFPGMIDPIIARHARSRNFESHTSRFSFHGFSQNHSLQILDDDSRLDFGQWTRVRIS